MINAGEMTARVELFSPSTTVDGTGQRSTAFASQGLRWAKASLTIRESVEAGGAEQLESVLFVLRYDPSLGINQGWRIKWDGSDYEVLTVLKDDTKRTAIDVIARFAR